MFCGSVVLYGQLALNCAVYQHWCGVLSICCAARFVVEGFSNLPLPLTMALQGLDGRTAVWERDISLDAGVSDLCGLG